MSVELRRVAGDVERLTRKPLGVGRCQVRGRGEGGYFRDRPRGPERGGGFVEHRSQSARRRAKTDRLDVGKLLALWLRWCGGERTVWSVVHAPSPEAEAQRQLTREIANVREDRKRVRNRIQALLATQGIRLELSARCLEPLASAQTGDGRARPAAFRVRLEREWAHLEAIHARMTAVTTARDHPWALVGGLAVSVRSEPRFTRDIDVAVAVADDRAAEQLVANLSASGFSLRLSLEQQALQRLAAVRLLPPGEPDEGIVVDLLFSSSGIEPQICRDAERVEVVPGLLVPIARCGHLVAMKLLALSPDRPHAHDLRTLLQEVSAEEPHQGSCGSAGDRARGRPPRKGALA